MTPAHSAAGLLLYFGHATMKQGIKRVLNTY